MEIRRRSRGREVGGHSRLDLTRPNYAHKRPPSKIVPLTASYDSAPARFPRRFVMSLQEAARG